MSDIFKFILFLIYTISVFFISSYYVLLGIAIINLLLMITLKIDIKKAVNNILQIMPFIIFTAIINIFFQDINGAVHVFIRLVLVCNMTYIFSKIITTVRLAIVIEKFFYPLKLFNINPKDISIVISIAIAFIPILKNELTQVKFSLKSKGINSSFWYMLKNLNLFFKPFFVSLIRRVSNIEASLKAKAYVETK